MSALATILGPVTDAPVASLVGDALQFIVQEQQSIDGTPIGGPAQLWDLTFTHLQLSVVALVIASLVAVPVGLILGHRRKGEVVAIAASNVGRAVPSLALIALFVAFVGTGFVNVALALVLLAIPPILTGTYVGVAAVDPEIVDAARGQGLTERQIVRQVELPLALASIFGGLRTSAVNVVATATIAPLAGVLTLGDPIIATSVYGDAGRLAASFLVAFLAVLTEVGFAAAQRAATPAGLRSSRDSSWRRRSPAPPMVASTHIDT
ncbi:MAG: ABC transporter permease [Solirubrobacteraceae bacterium]|nr:ABC transporter permease [Solirubrobacteraceae bacterium]